MPQTPLHVDGHAYARTVLITGTNVFAVSIALEVIASNKLVVKFLVLLRFSNVLSRIGYQLCLNVKRSS